MPTQDLTVDVRIKFDSGQTVPIEFNAPFTLKQTRGLEPYMFSIHLSDASKLPQPATQSNGCRCSFVFETPNATGAGRTTKEWKGWYLVRIEPSKSDVGLYVATFADVRWKLQYFRRTKAYNVQWPDGSYRDESTPQGANYLQWKAVDAAKDICKLFGEELDVSAIEESRFSILLPNNLGNSKGGGWAAAQWDEMIKGALVATELDIVMGLDGKLSLRERTGDYAGYLKSVRLMPRIVDTTGAGNNGWSRPRKLRLAFEVMMEAALESRLAGATSSSTPIFSPPENVMPRFTQADLDPEEWWNSQVAGELADTDWETVPVELERNGYALRSEAEGLICRNYFLPNIIPLTRSEAHGWITESSDPTENAQLALKKFWFDGVLRNCWRKTYRVKYPTKRSASPLTTALRCLSGLRFGRLTPGGDSISRGSVFADWSEEQTFAVRYKPGDPFDSEFSSNHAFDATRPAPFTARWIAESGNELIFLLEPTDSRRIGQAKVFPGLFARNLNYGSWGALTADGYIEETELQGEFDTAFDFRIILSGRLITPCFLGGVSSPVGQVEGRVLVVETTLYPFGSIPSLDLKSEAMTANFGFSKDQLQRAMGTLAERWPEKLLNQKDVEKLVADVADKTRAVFEQGDSGGIAVPGVEALNKAETGGDIHEMSVTIGDPDPWSIKTQYIVLPGVSAISVDPEERDGRPPALIAQE